MQTPVILTSGSERDVESTKISGSHESESRKKYDGDHLMPEREGFPGKQHEITHNGQLPTIRRDGCDPPRKTPQQKTADFRNTVPPKELFSCPTSVSDLKSQAQASLLDPSKSFNHWLQVAERCRYAGQDYFVKGQLEGAFVDYTKAAMLIFQRIPEHHEFTTLNSYQRDNLASVSTWGMICPVCR